MKTFPDLGSFARHLGALSSPIRRAETAGLEAAAVMVETEAKSLIGAYQDAAGPFAAWAELADATKAERSRLGFTENDPGLRSGQMRDSIGHVVRGRQGAAGSNDDHLLWFEFGTSRQPPRSVLGLAAVHKGEAGAKVIGEAVAYALAAQRAPRRPQR
jgi:flagellar hook-length control protein FliK